MDDLISRQMAIDALCEEPLVWSGNDDYGQGLNNQWHYDVNALKKVPSAQRWIPADCVCEKINEAHNEGYDVGYWAGRRDYEQKWIPCSERLPEQNRWYIISNGLDSWVAIWSRENKEWLSVTGLDYTITDVIAWMEFPEPYREDGENDG